VAVLVILLIPLVSGSSSCDSSIKDALCRCFNALQTGSTEKQWQLGVAVGVFQNHRTTASFNAINSADLSRI
jgi:hypothetical protein